MRRAALRRRPRAPLPAVADEPPLWFVTVTVGGDPVEPEEAREALERLSLERPFVVSARYDASRAEVCYWDECEDVQGAITQALRMWSDHSVTAALPDWQVIGLEAVDRDTARWHTAREHEPHVRVLGEIRPFD